MGYLRIGLGIGKNCLRALILLCLALAAVPYISEVIADYHNYHTPLVKLSFVNLLAIPLALFFLVSVLLFLVVNLLSRKFLQRHAAWLSRAALYLSGLIILLSYLSVHFSYSMEFCSCTRRDYYGVDWSRDPIVLSLLLAVTALVQLICFSRPKIGWSRELLRFAVVGSILWVAIFGGAAELAANRWRFDPPGDPLEQQRIEREAAEAHAVCSERRAQCMQWAVPQVKEERRSLCFERGWLDCDTRDWHWVEGEAEVEHCRSSMWKICIEKLGLSPEVLQWATGDYSQNPRWRHQKERQNAPALYRIALPALVFLLLLGLTALLLKLRAGRAEKR